MDTAYWNLFWTTGMPEAWLMSRDRLGLASAPEPEAECSRGTDSSEEDVWRGLTSGASAALQG